jgi:hypothetical protein
MYRVSALQEQGATDPIRRRFWVGSQRRILSKSWERLHTLHALEVTRLRHYLTLQHKRSSSHARYMPM